MFPEWSVLFGVVIGAVIGSFLNMAIYRLPRGISFVNPSKSFCPNCNHPLEAVDLVPLFSWLSTGGKCRYCKAPVASRYFFVELLTAALFAGLWHAYFVASFEPAKEIFYSIETAGLVAVIYIDWELFIIPDELNAFLLVIAIAFRAFDHSLMAGLWGGIAGWGMIWGIALFGRVLLGKDAMGHGDIKMMRGIGFVLGAALVAASVAMAVLLGLVFGLLFIGLATIAEKRAARTHSGSATEPAAAQAATNSTEEQSYPPESIGSLFKFGAWYLLCLDVVALPFPKMYKLIGESPEVEEIDEDWKPSLTTIPFGPYLAAGAIVCMLFSKPIEQGLGNWWQSATGKAAISQARTGARERTSNEIASMLKKPSMVLNPALGMWVRRWDDPSRLLAPGLIQAAREGNMMAHDAVSNCVVTRVRAA